MATHWYLHTGIEMELLVAIVDNGTAIDAIKAGEVITVQPDGWGWGSEELANANWRIISAPILGTHAEILQMGYILGELMVHGKTYPRKAYLLNLSALPNSSQFSGARTAPIISMQSTDVIGATTKVA